MATVTRRVARIGAMAIPRVTRTVAKISAMAIARVTRTVARIRVKQQLSGQ